MKDKDFERFIENMDNQEVEPVKNKNRITMIVLQNLPNIYQMIVDGLTVSEICQRLGVDRRNWYHIIKKYPELQAVVDNAENAKTEKVKQSLYMMCLPRVVKAQKVLSNGTIVEYEKVLEPDPSMVKFFLLNKAPDEFKEKREVEVTKKEFIVEIIDTDNYTVIDEEKAEEG
ncbi:helix-turn-helix domain-containing protein [Pseudobacteroides cellulosolvens]|uniref:Uncharacterized protein n=1 Tax=Pseudobacteroides cellulosolvens ATCC 35603 = DSM 2933 TaxID=398512 RepID=A0A0L6JR43_9FIRM|nr:helix-turn-helix domain-containing protein [Pseudobacteroides cellulosolvens]KNY28306.1 hypothetical protein Bccel_3580 [Pseudobacteroides cellulosolvens ATCC 35603 = DSM 2933]